MQTTGGGGSESLRKTAFWEFHVGNLAEPLTGRRWDRATIQREYAARLAHLRRHGLSASDRVFLHYGNTLEFFVDLLAIWALGGCAVPIDTRLSDYEVEILARSARPRLSLWLGDPPDSIARCLTGMGVEVLNTGETGVNRSPGFPDLAVTPSPDPEAPALILFTSGTTGDPKGVVHTRRSLGARWASLRRSLGVEKFRRTLCLLPTHLGHGLICNCLFPWLSGQDLFILPPFSPEVICRLGPLVDEHRISFLSSVPTVWRLALRMSPPPTKGTLERISCGSAPLSGFLWNQIREWSGASEVFNAYGITETGSWLAGTTVPGFSPEDGLIGEAWGGVIRVLKSAGTGAAPEALPECAAEEAGYVWVKTAALMKGYLGRDDLTRAVVSRGWFVTGDIGVLDKRGWLYLKGREREEINKGGVKVYPSDIDAVAERFDQTLDVCTFGFEDPLLGENVGIALVLRDPNEENLRGIVRWITERVGTYQVPHRWYLLDAIPRTARGKVNRSIVANRCAAMDAFDLRGLFR
jgi:acyl-CoA synthetase (AMP-forming)/AMP-acid ligase II